MNFSDKEKKRFESIIIYEIVTSKKDSFSYIELLDIISDKIKKKDDKKLNQDEIEEIANFIIRSDKFKCENNIYHLDKKLTFKDKLEVTNNITVNYIKNNPLEYVVQGLTVAMIITVIVAAVDITSSGIKKNIDNKNYNKAIIVYKDDFYNISDLYVVYSIDSVHFCNRKLSKVTENSLVDGESIFGFGEVNDKYYRDEIYAYYDVKTGNKVCEDHEDGFFVEKLSDLSLQESFKSHDYKMSLNEIEQEVNLDYLLSRESNPKQK